MPRPLPQLTREELRPLVVAIVEAARAILEEERREKAAQVDDRSERAAS